MITAYLDAVVAAQSKNTLRITGLILRKADRELPFGLPTAAKSEIETWFNTRRNRPWSRNTRHTYDGILRGFYVWASDIDDPWISENPMRKIPSPKKPKGVPRPAQVDQAHWAVTEASDPWRLICTLAVYSGLRACEIATLHRNEVDATSIYVANGKGGKAAVVPCHPAIWDAVKDLPDGPVIRRTDRWPVTARWVSDSTNRFLRKAGIAWSLHKLRHRYITEAYRRTGRDMVATQHLARHESPATTAGYIFLEEDSLAAAVGLITI
jgi:integrase/recombinase XerC